MAIRLIHLRGKKKIVKKEQIKIAKDIECYLKSKGIICEINISHPEWGDRWISIEDYLKIVKKNRR